MLWPMCASILLIEIPKMNICAQNLHDGNFKFSDSSSQNESIYIILFILPFARELIWVAL